MNVGSKVVYHNADRPEDGTLEWFWGDLFIIKDEDGAEIDEFNVCHVERTELAQANRKALEHFKRVERNQIELIESKQFEGKFYSKTPEIKTTSCAGCVAISNYRLCKAIRDEGSDDFKYCIAGHIYKEVDFNE